MTTISTGQDEERDMTAAEQAIHDANEPTVAKLALDKLALLEKEIIALANEKVGEHIDPCEKPHWMGVSDKFAKRNTDYLNQMTAWMEEFVFAHIEERQPDEVAYPRPSLPSFQIDFTLWDNLGVIQSLTEPIRTAAALILDALYQMTNEEINALPSNWVSTHNLWP